MSHFKVNKSSLFGTISLPPSKSHTLRALLFATLADGVSEITNQLDSPDTDAMIKACHVLGGAVLGNRVIGRGGDRTLHGKEIDAQNSGQVLRFVAACAALSDTSLTITGDHSLQTRRPVAPLLHGLQQLGGYAASVNNTDFAPIIVKGPIEAGIVRIDGRDSQPVSALLIASAMLIGTTRIEVIDLGERPWIMLTLDWLKRMGVQVTVTRQDHFIVEGVESFAPFTYHVPGDLSSVSFLLVAALLTESDLLIENVDLQDIQGDKVIVTILQKMGAVFTIDHGNKTIRVKGPQELIGCDIDVNECIDALPILAVCGSHAVGKTRLYNGAIARCKESDRIKAIVSGLSLMGASIVEEPDGLTVSQKALCSAHVNSFFDHRIALALSVAAFSAKGETTICNTECVKKSYPGFVDEMQQLGGRIK